MDPLFLISVVKACTEVVDFYNRFVDIKDEELDVVETIDIMEAREKLKKLKDILNDNEF